MSSPGEQDQPSASGITTNSVQPINQIQQQLLGQMQSQIFSQCQPYWNPLNNQIFAFGHRSMFELASRQSLMPGVLAPTGPYQPNQQNMMPVPLWGIGANPILDNMSHLTGNPASAEALPTFTGPVSPLLLNNVYLPQSFATMETFAGAGNANAGADAHAASTEQVPVQGTSENLPLPTQSSEVILHPSTLDEPHSTTSPSLTLQSSPAAIKMSPAKAAANESIGAPTQTASFAASSAPSLLKVTQKSSELKSPETKVRQSATNEPHSTSSPSLTSQSSTKTKMSPAKFSANEIRGSTPTQTANFAPSVLLVRIAPKPSSSNLPEIKLSPSTSEKGHLAPNASFSDKQDAVSLPQFEHPLLEDTPSPQDNSASAETQTPQQIYNENNIASPNGKIEEGIKTLGSSDTPLLGCDISEATRELEGEKGASSEYNVKDDKKTRDLHSKLQHVCDITGCRRVFSRKKGQKRHLAWHRGEKNVHVKPQYSCDVTGCTKVFPTDDGRRRHVACHRGEKNFTCCYCDKGFALKFLCVRHEMRHENQKPKFFECDYCKKQFNRIGRLENHIISHVNRNELFMPENGDNNNHQPLKTIHHCVYPGVKAKQRDLRPDFVCRMCQKLFKDLSDFNSHLESQHKMAVYICSWPNCGHTFTHKCYLNRHEKIHSVTKRIYPCPNCDKEYPRLYSLTRHLRDKH